jgi:hypothetical protein
VARKQILKTALGAHNLANHVQRGKQAMESNHRHQVSEKQGTVTDSLDFDSALRAMHPTEHRWDYFVGVSSTGGDHVVGIEVHPATSHGISDLIAKKIWFSSASYG